MFDADLYATGRQVDSLRVWRASEASTGRGCAVKVCARLQGGSARPGNKSDTWIKREAKSVVDVAKSAYVITNRRRGHITTHHASLPPTMAASLSAPGALSAHVLGRRTVKSRRTATQCRAVEEPTSISAPANFTPPEPKKFTVAEGSLGRVVSSAIPLVLRAGTGALINGWSPSIVDDDDEGYSIVRVAGKKLKEASSLGPRPAETIELYEYEGSPYCRKVREAAAVLDLDILMRPCPSGETYWRPMAKAEGVATFPYMKDPNTGESIAESDDIVEYLFRTYGPAANDKSLSTEGLKNAGPEVLGIPMMLRRGGITNPTCYAAALARLKGLRARPSRAAAAATAGTPVKPLTLWTYEASPFTKAVRESLTELAIPHVMRYCPRGSTKRDELLEKTGRFQVPFLEDPNTGVEMFESASMVTYLEETYAL